MQSQKTKPKNHKCLFKKKNQFTWSLFVSGLVLKLECCFKTQICMFWSKCNEPVTVSMTSLSEFCLLPQGLCCLDCSAPLCRLAFCPTLHIYLVLHLTSGSNNNRLFMAPHLLRARSTYKGLRICTFHHTHTTFSKYSQHILHILSFSTFLLPHPHPHPTANSHIPSLPPVLRLLLFHIHYDLFWCVFSHFVFI